MSQPVAINLGGLTHRESRNYTLHCCGWIYCLFWIALLYADYQLLRPVINGDVNKIGIEQIENTDDELLNPEI